MSEPVREELRPRLRDEHPPANTIIVVRGGPATARQLTVHARRTHKAFVLDGQPLWGVSVFGALDDLGPASLDGLLQRLWSYRVVHLPSAGQLRGAGFDLLPTFTRPHFTLQLTSADEPELARLLAALGPEKTNRYHWIERRRR
jgi:hypothetical protein